MRPVAAWIGRLALWFALAFVGAQVGLRVAGPIERDTALGTVELNVKPAWHGEINAYIPIADWGIIADPFDSPLSIDLEPRGIDRDAVVKAASGNQEILRQAEKDGQSAATDALVRGLIYAMVGVILMSGLSALIRSALPDTTPRRIIGWGLAPLIIGTAGIAVTMVAARTSFNPDAFNQPRFYARGAEFQQLLQVAGQTADDATQGYENQVQRTLAGYAALLQTGANISGVGVTPAEPDAALISDLHSNVLVLDPFRSLFDGHPVFVVGDFGQSGTATEGRLFGPRVAELGDPVVAVSGNHDSEVLMESMAGDGVIVLTEDGRLRPDGTTDGKPVQRIGSLTVAGHRDPLEWPGDDPSDPSRVFSFSERPNGDEEYKEAQQEIVDWFDGLPERPQVVLIHQNGLAQHLAETLDKRDKDAQPALLIMTGHDHKQHVDLHGQITVVDAGTAGAGGLFGVGTQYVGVATFQIDDAGLPPSAIDLIRVDPTSGAAEADRVVPDSRLACDAERVFCEDEDRPESAEPP